MFLGNQNLELRQVEPFGTNDPGSCM